MASTDNEVTRAAASTAKKKTSTSSSAAKKKTAASSSTAKKKTASSGTAAKKKTTASSSAAKKKTSTSSSAAKKKTGTSTASASAGVKLNETEKKLIKLYRAADAKTKKEVMTILEEEKSDLGNMVSSLLNNKAVKDVVSGLFKS